MLEYQRLNPYQNVIENHVLPFRNSQDIGEAVSDTVETLERSGGKHAFAHIKQCIPTCEATLETVCRTFLRVVLVAAMRSCHLMDFSMFQRTGMGCVKGDVQCILHLPENARGPTLLQPTSCWNLLPSPSAPVDDRSKLRGVTA